MGIEIITERLMEAQVSKMHEGVHPPGTIFILDREIEELGLQPLKYGDEISGMLFDSLGTIYITRWEGRDAIDTPNGLSLPDLDSKAYKVLGMNDPRQDLLSNLPQNAIVQELKVVKIKGGLESAIRMQQHVLESYTGRNPSELQQIGAVLERVGELSTEFILSTPSQERLDELGAETREFLKQNGLENPRDPDKIKMREMLLRATYRDSLGRTNPPADRFQLRAAALAAGRRGVVSGFIADKYGINLEALLMERYFTRNALRRADRRMLTILRELQFEHPSPDAAVKALNLVARELSIPRLQPYVSPSTEAMLHLVRCRQDKLETTRKIIGAGLSDGVMAQTPAVEFIRQGNIKDAIDRINYADWLVLQTLKKHEPFLILS